MSQFETDFMQRAESEGYRNVSQYLDVIFQELSHGVSPARQQDEVLNAVDEVLLIRSLPEEALKSSNALLDYINERWDRDHQAVHLSTETAEDDKLSRAISVYDKFMDCLGSHIGKVTLELTFNENVEPSGWDVRPRGVTPPEFIVNQVVSLAD